MNSRELIDAQFDRAVEIVQNLPKTGPIQTGYEEKLTMYRYVYSMVSLSLLAYAAPAVYTSKVRHASTVHLHLSSVLKRTRLSNRWERQVLETRNLGYVGSRKVVCPVVPSLSLVDSPCRDAWAKHKDLD